MCYSHLQTKPTSVRDFAVKAIVCQNVSIFISWENIWPRDREMTAQYFVRGREGWWKGLYGGDLWSVTAGILISNMYEVLRMWAKALLSNTGSADSAVLPWSPVTSLCWSFFPLLYSGFKHKVLKWSKIQSTRRNREDGYPKVRSKDEWNLKKNLAWILCMRRFWIKHAL